MKQFIDTRSNNSKNDAYKKLEKLKEMMQQEYAALQKH